MILLEATGLNPQDFFTKGSFATLLGCTGIVYIVSGVVQSVFNFKPKWFALLLSIVVSFIAASINAEGAKEPALIRYLISILNGFLIYSSAAGSNQLLNQNQANAAVPPGPGPAAPVVPNRKFNTNWWK